MSTYQSVTTDGANVIVASVADGTYAMCQIPPGYPPNFIHHTTYAQAKLVSNSGKTKLGTASTQACPSCYVSVQSGTQLPIGSDTSWDFNWYDSVTCSMAGVVWTASSGSRVGVYFASGFGKYISGSPPSNCHYQPNCTNTTTPKCGNNGWLQYEPFQDFCEPYISVQFMVVTWDGKYDCYGMEFIQEDDPAGGWCTPK